MTGGPTPSDRLRVEELLGRTPQGGFEIVVRAPDGDPVVLRNDPLLDDGTPMPTRYWLIGPNEIKRIGRLEADGGVNDAEAAIDPAELAAAHERYASERDAAIPTDHTGPRPYGGVGGTRVGVKCLHAHWAWHLAGGDDPVGRWIEARLDAADAPADQRRDQPLVTLATETTTVTVGDDDPFTVPWGSANLTSAWLTEHDPPRPAALTNALGAIDDHLDDVARERPGFATAARLTFAGTPIDALARVEVGSASTPAEVPLERAAAEEIFRMLTTETSADRAHNPGLPSADVETIIATCCIVLAFARRLRLDEVSLLVAHPEPTAS